MTLLGRGPRTPLVTRLLAAITAVLAISFVATYVVESSLTRSALREQAESVLEQRARQARAVLYADLRAVLVELQYINQDFRRDVRSARTPAERRALTEILVDVGARRPFTVIGAYDRDGDPIVVPTGPALEPPPDAVFGSGSSSVSARVVDTVDGRRAYVAGEILGEAPHEVLVVFGYVYDQALARTLQDTTGGDDIVLESEGQVVAWSLPFPPPTQLDNIGVEEPGIPIVEIADQVYWGSVEPVARVDEDWGSSARLRVLIREPLARLDAQLVRNRLGAGVALLVIATLLAWAVSRRITRPLRELTATAAQITEGDRDAAFPVTTEDEVGVLARALEDMRQGLGNQLELIQRQAEALRDAGGRLVHAQDEARRRMAADLHDGVQRQLVMLRLHIGFGRERIRRSPDEAEDVLDELATEIDQTLGRLRETAQGIYPSILRDRGLAGALYSLGTRSQLPVEVELTPEPLPRLPYDVEANTYFLVSEAVTNAIKHAQAARVGVAVRVEDEVVHVMVSDDGRGFDVAASAGGRGLGNMQDRAGALGGHVEVSTGTGGTVVRARLPVAGSVAGALEEEEDRRDPPVQLDVLAQSEFLEDRVDVLLDGPFRDRQVAGDATVAPTRGHHREDVQLPRRQAGEP